MINFRYHVVSLAAVLFALAVGVVLGAGPLQRVNDGAEREAGLPENQVEVLRAQTELAQAKRFRAAYAEATSPRLVSGLLDGRSVALVTLPGADPSAAASLEATVLQAGGTLTGRVALAEELLDVDNRQLVEELSQQMVDAGGRSLNIASAQSGYERMGLLIGRALMTRTEAGQPSDAESTRIVASLRAANLATVPDEIDRAERVVVLAGAPYGTEDLRAGAGAIITELLGAFGERAERVVLAGPVAAGDADGLVFAVRGAPDTAARVSSVLQADATTGAITTVLALGDQAPAGSYGAAESPDGVVPPLPEGAPTSPPGSNARSR